MRRATTRPKANPGANREASARNRQLLAPPRIIVKAVRARGEVAPGGIDGIFAESATDASPMLPTRLTSPASPPMVQPMTLQDDCTSI